MSFPYFRPWPHGLLMIFKGLGEEYLQSKKSLSLIDLALIHRYIVGHDSHSYTLVSCSSSGLKILPGCHYGKPITPRIKEGYMISFWSRPPLETCHEVRRNKHGSQHSASFRISNSVDKTAIEIPEDRSSPGFYS